MGLRVWAAELLAGDTIERRVAAEYETRIADVEARFETRLQEALQAAHTPASRQMEDAGYRRLGDSSRDLPQVTQSRMIEVALWLWDRNPVGRRIIETHAEWMVGEGATIEAEDPRTHALLMEWWRVNRMDLNLLPFVRELALFGEDFASVHANPYSGVIRMGVFDPGSVREVVVDPDNAAQIIGIVQRSTLTMRERRWKARLRMEDEEALSPMALRERERMTDGELLCSAINKLRRARRGRSELFALSDWLDGYEQLLFAELNRSRAMANYFWDMEFEGWSQKEIDAYLAEMKPPRPFSVFGHNEKVHRKLVGPEAGSGETMETSARLFRNHALGGAALGEHMYGGGGDVNRSTSESMDGHTIKSLTAKQTNRKAIVEDRAQAQIEEGIRVGRIRDTEAARRFTISLPDLSTLDLIRVAQGIQSIANGVSILLGDQMIDRDTAGRFVAAFAQHAGVKVDAARMLEQARKEGEDSLAAQAARGYDRTLLQRAG